MDGTEELVARARRGDRAALNALLQQHRTQIRRAVMRLLGGRADVEDVVQEVLIQVFRSIGKFRGDSKFTTWLYRVALNVSKMHLRRQASRPRLVHLTASNARKERVDPHTPASLAERHARIAALHQLVAALPEKKRVVLILHDFEGQTPKDIANIVGAPVMTVRTRLFYARKELLAAMAKEPLLREAVPAENEKGSKPTATADERANPSEPETSKTSP